MFSCRIFRLRRSCWDESYGKDEKVTSKKLILLYCYQIVTLVQGHETRHSNIHFTLYHGIGFRAREGEN
jgi:hypothetical protein